jgi:tetratricopeptide (TPR) repeat protein
MGRPPHDGVSGGESRRIEPDLTADVGRRRLLREDGPEPAVKRKIYFRSVTVAAEPRGYEGAAQRGVGRTLLVEEYALRFGAAWPGGVVWLRAYGGDHVTEDLRERLRRDQLRAVARRMGIPVQGLPPNEVETAITRHIAARNLPVLWVVDDLPKDAPRDQWVLPDPLIRAVLIVAEPRPGETPELTVGPLRRSEAYALLTRAWRPHAPDEEASAARIVEDLGGYALAVDAAGGTGGVGAGGKGHGAVRAAGRAATDDLRTLAFALFDFVPEGRAMPVAGVTARVVDQLGPEGRDALRLAGILGLAPLGRPLLASALSASEGLDAETAGNRADAGLLQLDRAGIAVRGPAEPNSEPERWIHPLWRVVLAHRDPEPWRAPLLREGLVRALGDRLAAPSEAGPSASLLAAARLCGTLTEGPSEASLLHGLGAALLSLGDPEESERAYRQAHAAREQLLGTAHAETLASLDGLAQAHWARLDRAGAVSLLEDVLALRRERHGEGDPGTLATLDRLARWYFDVGRKAESRALIERLQDGRRRALGPFHPSTLEASARLAQVLAADGETSAAMRLVDDALTRVGRQPDRAHVAALEGLVAVGIALRTSQELASARRVLEACSQLLKRLVGPDDLRTITAMTWYAKVLVDLEDLGVARRVETDTLAALIRVHGDSHPDTLTMMNNLGTTLSGLGELPTARQHLERAWKQRTVVLGARHTDTVVTGWNLHMVTLRLGQDSSPILAELEWLLEARPEGLSAKQRKVREALQEMVATPPPTAREGERGATWSKAFTWIANPFRRK